MDFDLKKHTILLTVAGSRAYGMSIEESDVDLKGICIPPAKYRDGFLHRFEQADKKDHMKVFYDLLTSIEKEKGKQGEVEGSVYEIRKFFNLAANNNPNIFDILFCRDEEIRFCGIPGNIIRSYAYDFLSTKCYWTFGSYAKAQLKRIELHRGYLLNPPTHKPTRVEFNLPERTVIPFNQLDAARAERKKKIDSGEVEFGNLDESSKIYIQNQLANNLSEMEIGSDEKYAVAARMIGYNENFIDLLDRERRYRASITKYSQYQKWKKNRNPERAAMEAKFGYDGKHAGHLIRLSRMCTEILRDERVNIYRDDAEELLAIRNGIYTYEQLMELVKKEEIKTEKAYKTSKLPKTPDKEKLDELCCRLIRATVFV